MSVKVLLNNCQKFVFGYQLQLLRKTIIPYPVFIYINPPGYF